MLLADNSDWHGGALRVDDDCAELAFSFEDALGVVPQGPVAEVGVMLLGSIEPTVNVKVVVGLTAEATGRRLGVLDRVHYKLPPSMSVWVVMMLWSIVRSHKELTRSNVNSPLEPSLISHPPGRWS